MLGFYGFFGQIMLTLKMYTQTFYWQIYQPIYLFRLGNLMNVNVAHNTEREIHKPK